MGTERGIVGHTEVAALLGVHPNTLSRWRDSGRVRVARRVGNRSFYMRADVNRLLADVLREREKFVASKEQRLKQAVAEARGRLRAIRKEAK